MIALHENEKRDCHMKFKTLTLLGLLILMAAYNSPTSGSTNGTILNQDIEFNAANFAEGSGTGFIVTDDGLTLAADAVTAVYTSPVIKTPFPFNAAVPRWLAAIPEMASLELQVRTKTAAGNWSDWFHIHENHDWTLPEDLDVTGEMVTVPAEDTRHDFLQYEVSFGRFEGDPAPVLQQLTITIIDSTDGPTTEEMLAQQAALDAARPDSSQATTGYPRPSVISRGVWCLSADCNYTSGLAYSPATHMVVHHTVSSNSSSDWSAVVRAIWNYHTYTKGWGDIGYNYLVDRNGVIYEGHMNQDYWNLDVIGTHAADANAGSMGVSLIGTYTTAAEYPVYDVPPPAMQTAAANLMAWKADQRNIDVYSASRLVNMSWGLPHVMGHRDVYGGTATVCPGGNAYALLPHFRDEIAQRMNFVTPYIHVDELSSAFTKSNNNWYEGPRGCGNSGHSYYTWNVNSANLIENWGEWRPNVPQNGRYEIQVYAPYCDTDSSETDGAIYTITHANGTNTVTVSHADNIGLWMSLGYFDLNAGTGNKIRLTDLTTGDPTNYDYAVWFDAIRLRPTSSLPDVTVQNSAPVNGYWSTQTAVTFNWNINHPALVNESILQVASDPAFNNIIYTKTVPGDQTSATHDFGHDYAALYWRVRSETIQFTIITSSATRLGIDTTAPTSAVSGVYEIPNRPLVIGWGGNDATSGIAKYTVQYRAQGSSTWQTLVADTVGTAAEFTPPNPSLIYEFRSRATDRAGNIEPAHANPDINTSQSIFLPHAMVMPIIRR
jgi:hypothetical protein